MLRANAAQGIVVPENGSKWSVETTLKQWKIAKSLANNNRQVNIPTVTKK